MPDYIGGGYATPRADLGEALVEYRRENGGNWIGTKLLPTISVKKRAATFSVFTRASILQQANVLRATRGRYNRIQGETKDRTYYTQNYGLEGEIDDSERELYSSDFDADFVAMTVVERAVKLAQELRCVQQLQNATTFTAGSAYTDYSAGGLNAPWTTLSTDIYGQIIDAKEASRRRTGLMPNTLAVSRPVWNLMKKNTVLQGKFKFPNPVQTAEGGVLLDGVLEENLRSVLGLKNVLIGDEVYNSAAELNPNSPMESVTDCWSASYALLAYVCPEGSSMQEPCIGRTFVWEEYAGELDVQSYREEQIESDIVRVKHFTQELVFDVAYGQLLRIQ